MSQCIPRGIYKGIIFSTRGYYVQKRRIGLSIIDSVCCTCSSCHHTQTTKPIMAASRVIIRPFANVRWPPDVWETQFTNLQQVIDNADLGTATEHPKISFEKIYRHVTDLVRWAPTENDKWRLIKYYLQQSRNQQTVQGQRMLRDLFMYLVRSTMPGFGGEESCNKRLDMELAQSSIASEITPISTV